MKPTRYGCDVGGRNSEDGDDDSDTEPPPVKNLKITAGMSFRISELSEVF